MILSTLIEYTLSIKCSCILFEIQKLLNLKKTSNLKLGLDDLTHPTQAYF